MKGHLPSTTVLIAAVIALASLPALAGSYWRPKTDANYELLVREAEAKSVALSNKVAEAEAAGVNTDYARVTQITIELFKDVFAPWDRENPIPFQTLYAERWWMARHDPVGPIGVPFDELADCVEIADAAMARLQQQIDGEITLRDPPDFTSREMALNGTHYELDGRTVIPTKFFWHPFEEDLMFAYGRMGEGYLAVTDMVSSNEVDPVKRDELTHLMRSQTRANRVPQQFFLGHVIGATDAWQRVDHPDVFAVGHRLFTDYDIDHPLVRPWLDGFFAAEYAPAVAASGEAPRIHMLANEPTFSIREGGVNAADGVSAYTMDKYHDWLRDKYRDIASLNGTYGSGFASFDSVDYGMPLATNYQGGPVWYDWCRFNMDRVNDWFTYLHGSVKAVDPGNPTHIKLMGERALHHDFHDEGLDFEYIAKLVDMPGSDNQCSPRQAEWDVRFIQGWQDRYDLEWRNQSIMLDFMKSICPEKPFYDSEWHGLSAPRWRNFHTRPEYVRAVLWLAATHGMSAMNVWVWNRHADGSIDSRADFVGTTMTQPIQLDAFGRTVMELNAHGDAVRSLVPKERFFIVYYSKDAAIQDYSYSHKMADVYEALKLLNVPVGFTTPTELAYVSKTTQTLIVPPTPFIADADLAGLRAFAAAGGKIVLVEPAKSFVKNELGTARKDGAGFSPYASVQLAGAFPMADKFAEALEARKPSQPITVKITDTTGKPAYGVFHTQSVDPDTGDTLLSLINVSREQRQASLLRPSGAKVKVGGRNEITGERAASVQLLAPQDVLLLSISTAEDSSL